MNLPISCLVTGSIARKEYYIDCQSNVISDIDILIIIEHKSDLYYLKQYLREKLGFYLSNQLIEVSFIFCIKEYFYKNKFAHFVLSLSSDYILYNKLNIVIPANDSVPYDYQIIYHFQELSYYSSKYYYRIDANSLRKILICSLKIILIYHHLFTGRFLMNSDLIKFSNFLEKNGYVNKNTLDVILDITKYHDHSFDLVSKKVFEEICQIRNIYFDRLLLSTKYFYMNREYVNSETLYFVTRDLVFQENQGLTYKDAIL